MEFPMPMLHWMSIQLSPPPSPALFLMLFWKVTGRYKCYQPRGEILPTLPFLFVVGVDSWLRSWLWEKTSYSQLRASGIGSHHWVSYTMFFFEYSLCFPAVHSLRYPLRTDYTDIFDNPSHNSFCMPFFAWLVMCEIICINSASGTQVCILNNGDGSFSGKDSFFPSKGQTF
jgi:hypothetical protein